MERAHSKSQKLQFSPGNLCQCVCLSNYIISFLRPSFNHTSATHNGKYLHIIWSLGLIFAFTFEKNDKFFQSLRKKLWICSERTLWPMDDSENFRLNKDKQVFFHSRIFLRVFSILTYSITLGDIAHMQNILNLTSNELLR